MPRNLFAIQVEKLILLARRDDNGGYFGAHVRPEGPHAPEDPWTLWAGAGFARSFTLINDDPAAPSRFCLRAAGLFAAAEPNGEFTLNRLLAAEWEGLHFEQAMQ